MDVQRDAKDAYERWSNNHQHPAVQFKKIKGPRPVYAARIGLEHRALGKIEGDTITWFWIGAHSEYERLIKG
jgi:hypothetical protein